MFKTTRGIILREVRYKEADRMLTVLTQDMGKISVKARGALRKGSKTAAATQLLAFSELTMFEHKGYWSVNEGSTIEEFKGLRNDISALSLASYFAECTEAMSDEDEPNPMLLQLVLNCLYALSNGMYGQTLIKAAFELRLMAISGYEPDLNFCCNCGTAQPVQPRFSPRNGVICCEDCNNAQIQADCRLSENALEAMRYVINAPARRFLSFSLSQTDLDRMAKAAESYLLAQTERKFSTLDYWRQIR